MVLHAMVQIRELGTICHATWIHPNSLSQGHRDFVRPKKHLYSGDSVSLVGSTHRLNYSLYYELLCINLQFDHRFLLVSVLTISFTLRSLGEAIYDLAVPSSPNRSPPFVKFDIGTTQASPLMYYYGQTSCIFFFDRLCSFDDTMMIDLPLGC
ncbi:hypothetical protein P692DRAFT_20921358 [Suillus brevipes Sb2]|nr:hypothetical protein P692DRAFT_20921358 [Suillus brevipes Sb2]